MKSTEFVYTGTENLEWISKAQNYHQSIFNWIKNGISEEDIILEFGVGKGEFCNRFSNYNITGIELDTNLHKFIKCEVYCEIDELSHKYDLIYTINVLEHIDDDKSVLRKLRDKLTNNGRLKIFVPAREELFAAMDSYVGHYRRYDKGQLKKALEEAGFHVTNCKYFDFLGYFATIVHKLFRSEVRTSETILLLYDKIIFPISRLLDKITLGKIIGKNLIIECCKKQ